MIARFDEWYNMMYEMTKLMIQIDIRISWSNMIWHDTAHNADSGNILWYISFNCNIFNRTVWLHLSTLFHWVKLPLWRFFLMQKRILRRRMRWVEEYASLYTYLCLLVCAYSCSFSLSVSLITKEIHCVLIMILLMSIDVSFLSLLW